MEALKLNTAEMDDLGVHYRAIDARIPLQPIRTRAAYEKAVEAMNALIDGGAGDERHALAGLLDLLGLLIGGYEDAHRTPHDLPAAQVLRWLMDRHGLRQSDLPEVGSQGVVSEVLSGKRELNAGQIKRLSQRFGVGASAFL